MLAVQIQQQLADSAAALAERSTEVLEDATEALPAYLPALIRVAVILFLAVLFYRFIKFLIGRLVRRDIDTEDPVVKRLREQRAQTIASLLASFALVAVVTVTLLTVLSTFDVEIGPLLASVGVLGLAVSFGAQSLVKDVITGTFMLIEGQFGIGDVVRIGGVAGLVEKITLRTTILRDIDGAVHIIPNGTIDRVTNLTKTWSRAVLDIGVAYKEDIDRVLAVMRDLMREFHEDDQWGPLLVEPPEVAGVQELADSAVIVRITIKTLPLKQWEVAREARRRIKNRLDAENIEIPFPHTTFYWGERQMPPGLAESQARETERSSTNRY